jgi:hypothetical protein
MKTIMRALTVSFVVVMGLSAGSVCAEVLQAAPAQSTLLPDDESGWAQVALQFDLSGMRHGNGREIAWAYLEWTIEGVASDTRSEFVIHKITGPWDAAEAASGQISVTYNTEPLDEWSIEPRDYEQIGGLVRLDLGAVAGDWAAGTGNFGILLATRDVSRQTLGSQLTNARLVVVYRLSTSG